MTGFDFMHVFRNVQADIYFRIFTPLQNISF